MIEGDCASACAILALLLPERYLASGAALGFHDLWGRNEGSAELRRDRTEVLRQLEANGVDVAFIEPLMSRRELKYPDRSQLLSRGIVTGCWSTQAQSPEACDASLLSRSD